MEVTIKTANSDTSSSGKTASTRLYDIEIRPSYNRANDLSSITLSGTTEDFRGSGSRGGPVNAYTKKVEVTLSGREIRLIAEEALRSKLLQMPGRDEVLNARMRVIEAQQQLAKLLAIYERPFHDPDEGFVPKLMSPEELKKFIETNQEAADGGALEPMCGGDTGHSPVPS